MPMAHGVAPIDALHRWRRAAEAILFPFSASTMRMRFATNLREATLMDHPCISAFASYANNEGGTKKRPAFPAYIIRLNRPEEIKLLRALMDGSSYRSLRMPRNGTE